MIPPFIKAVGDIWCLARDGWTTPEVEKLRRLNWHDYFIQVRKTLIKKGTVIDVGAFIGDTAKWFEDYNLITFEPQRDAFMCLQHNVRGLHFPFPAGNGEMVMLSFGEAGNMGGRWVQDGRECRTIRIDDLRIDDCVLLKIDAEGYEPKVLDGAMDTIGRSLPIVVVEVNIPALARYGFSPKDVLDRFNSWTQKVIFEYSDTIKEYMIIKV